MPGDEVIKPVVAHKGQDIGSGNLEVDGPVKLNDTNEFCWDRDGSKQSNDVFFILTELFKSVRVGEQDRFFGGVISNGPVTMRSDCFGTLWGISRTNE